MMMMMMMTIEIACTELDGSLLMIHTALHACCAIAVPSATMHVQTTFFPLIFPFLCFALD